MEAKILFLIDTVTVRNEAIEYSLELAKRIDSSIILLLLLEYGTDELAEMERKHPEDIEAYIKSEIIHYMKKISTGGIVVEAEMRIGDPSSELLKFLAETKSIETIIWGGKTDLCNEKESNKKLHWLLKIRKSMKCPVVFPVKDNKLAV
ncbi:MAG: universal stress protein [Thermodesulfobacteriota bacterium]|nr:universal stress protein [Thermodesulfobacteriota bacterium]